MCAARGRVRREVGRGRARGLVIDRASFALGGASFLLGKRAPPLRGECLLLGVAAIPKSAAPFFVVEDVIANDKGRFSSWQRAFASRRRDLFREPCAFGVGRSIVSRKQGDISRRPSANLSRPSAISRRPGALFHEARRPSCRGRSRARKRSVIPRSKSAFDGGSSVASARKSTCSSGQSVSCRSQSVAAQSPRLGSRSPRVRYGDRGLVCSRDGGAMRLARAHRVESSAAPPGRRDASIEAGDTETCVTGALARVLDALGRTGAALVRQTAAATT